MQVEPIGTPLSCPLCRREAAVGLLCEAHVGRLAELLNPEGYGQVFAKPGERRVPPSIPALYGLLSAERGVRGPMAVGTSAFGPRSPADDDAVVLRDPRSRAAINGPDDRERAPDAPMEVLSHLAGRVMALRPPEVEPVWTIQGLSSYLHGQAEFIAHQPWAVAAYLRLRAAHSALRAGVGDPGPRPVGPCWVLVDDEGVQDTAGRWRCATPLYMPEQPPRAPDEPIQLPAIQCGGCGYRYTGAELVQLGRDLEEAS